MRWILDGYNVMYAAGALDGRTSRVRFRLARRRFLNEVASSMGDLARETVVVFDATHPPADFPVDSVYRGVRVIFAVTDPDADTRIERLIAAHSSPKGLTVVSSDRRVRLAASRRKARALKADDFLYSLPTLRYEQPKPVSPPLDGDGDGDLRGPTDEAEAEHWLRVFGELDDQPEIRQGLQPHAPMLTDAEIAELERQIDEEL